MKRTINVFIASLTFFSILLLGLVKVLVILAEINSVGQRDIIPSGGDVFDVASFSIINIILYLPFLFVIPSIKVLFFKGNSVLLPVVHLNKVVL